MRDSESLGTRQAWDVKQALSRGNLSVATYPLVSFIPYLQKKNKIKKQKNKQKRREEVQHGHANIGTAVLTSA